MKTESINITKALLLGGMVLFSLSLSLAIVNPENFLFLPLIFLIVVFFIKPISALMLFIFLVPFEATLIGLGEFFSFMKLFGVVVGLFYFIDKMVKNSLPSLKRIPNAKVIISFLAMILISAVFSTDPETSIEQYLTYLQLFVLYVIIVDYVDDAVKFKYVIGVFALAGLLNAVYAIYNYYFISGSVLGSEIYRAVGFMENANRFGYVQGMISFLAVPYFVSVRRKPVRFVLFFLVSAILLSSFLSLSRGTFIAFAATGLYALSVMFRQRNIAIGLIILIILGTLIIPEAYWNRIQTIYYADPTEGSRSTRLAFIQDGFLLGLEHPIVGVGLGRFKEEFLKFSNKVVSEHAGGAHNMYVSLMAENGIPVLIVFLLLLGRIYRKLVMPRKGSPDSVPAYVISTELAMVFTFAAGFFGTIEYSKMFWLLLALSAVAGKLGAVAANTGQASRF